MFSEKLKGKTRLWAQHWKVLGASSIWTTLNSVLRKQKLEKTYLVITSIRLRYVVFSYIPSLSSSFSPSFFSSCSPPSFLPIVLSFFCSLEYLTSLLCQDSSKRAIKRLFQWKKDFYLELVSVAYSMFSSHLLFLVTTLWVTAGNLFSFPVLKPLRISP